MVVDDEEMVWRASMVKDLVMARDGVCCLSSDEFSIDDAYAPICVYACNYFLILFFSPCMYFEYDL